MFVYLNNEMNNIMLPYYNKAGFLILKIKKIYFNECIYQVKIQISNFIHLF